MASVTSLPSTWFQACHAVSLQGPAHCCMYEPSYCMMLEIALLCARSMIDCLHRAAGLMAAIASLTAARAYCDHSVVYLGAVIPLSIGITARNGSHVVLGQRNLLFPFQRAVVLSALELPHTCSADPTTGASQHCTVIASVYEGECGPLQAQRNTQLETLRIPFRKKTGSPSRSSAPSASFPYSDFPTITVRLTVDHCGYYGVSIFQTGDVTTEGSPHPTCSATSPWMDFGGTCILRHNDRCGPEVAVENAGQCGQV